MRFIVTSEFVDAMGKSGGRQFRQANVSSKVPIMVSLARKTARFADIPDLAWSNSTAPCTGSKLEDGASGVPLEGANLLAESDNNRW